VSHLLINFFYYSRAVVIHSGKDDLGLGGNAASLANGNSGVRIACGVIGICKFFIPFLTYFA
jgi:hypothetical protein